jgi:hypothetical protein
MNPTTAPVSSSLPSAPTALLRRLEWQARHAVNTSVSGDYRSAFRGRGMEFDQVVKYQWGDDPRDIDWNVTARLGEPYRKRFVEERDLSVIFVFEDSPALQFGSEGRTRRQTGAQGHLARCLTPARPGASATRRSFCLPGAVAPAAKDCVAGQRAAVVWALRASRHARGLERAAAALSDGGHSCG